MFLCSLLASTDVVALVYQYLAAVWHVK